jgi:hypothetical protein
MRVQSACRKEEKRRRRRRVKTPSSHGHEDVRHETAAWKKKLFQRTKRTWEWKNSLGLARFDGGGGYATICSY